MIPHTALGRGYMFSQKVHRVKYKCWGYKDPGDHLGQPFHVINEDTDKDRE